LLKLEKVSFIRNDRFILKDIDLSMESGQNWVILGKNGSGKTTLINLLYGYLWPTSGKVSVFEKTYGEYPIKLIQSKIGILQSSHQEERLQRNLSVKDVISSGLLNSIGIYSELTQSQLEKIDQLIESNTWIKDSTQNYSLLSSGEKKKVLLLRALISEPEILVLDEPCSSLDLAAREDFFSLLESYRRYAKLIILITHRTDEIPIYFNYALLLKEGQIVASGRKNEIFNSNNLTEVYGVNVELIEKDGIFFTNIVKH